MSLQPDSYTCMQGIHGSAYTFGPLKYDGSDKSGSSRVPVLLLDGMWQPVCAVAMSGRDAVGVRLALTASSRKQVEVRSGEPHFPRGLAAKSH